MPADIGTKVLGAARFEDLAMLLSFAQSDKEQKPAAKTQPQIAQALVIKVLLAVLIASQAVSAEANQDLESRVDSDIRQLGWAVGVSACIGFGGFLGLTAAKWLVGKLSSSGIQRKGKDPRPRDPTELSDADPEDPCQTLAQPLLEPSSDFKSQASPAPATYEDVVEAAEVTQYRPSYEDLAAAYPSELGDLVPRSDLRESERFAQEYVDRCTYLQCLLRERCEEVRVCQERLFEARNEVRGLQEELRSTGVFNGSATPYPSGCTNRLPPGSGDIPA